MRKFLSYLKENFDWGDVVELALGILTLVVGYIYFKS